MKDELKTAAAATGKAAGTAATWLAGQAVSAWRTVDPDLRTHLAQLPLVGLTLLASGRPGIEALPDDGHRPVVFVHGLGGAPGNFLPMRLYFRLRGRGRTYAPGLSADASLPDQGRQVAAAIAEVARCNGLAPDDPIDVVAHSMGGLAARFALQDEDTARRVATLVTLGTPHAGSHLARYGGKEYSRALRPDSDDMTRLARQVPWAGRPALPRLVSMWSHSDVILLPATSARLEGAENVEMPGFTHYSYLLHPDAWQRVFEALHS